MPYTRVQKRKMYATSDEEITLKHKEWKENNNNGNGWTIKYYKGLGTYLEIRKTYEPNKKMRVHQRQW